MDIDKVIALPPIAAQTFAQMGWAEDEIESARRRHKEKDRGPLWRAFALLKPTADRMTSEAVYRAHCGELLERVAAGKDTRPGSDIELVLALSRTSNAAPMNPSACCLYFRLMSRCLPRHWARLSHVDLPAYEKVHGAKADEYEQWLRSKLRQDWR
ncbi:hypothetical protein [Streptomyces griseus]|uniref:hypothetical protein n=1 Tax=Streptomyces griseus TaxID=1911 RepID=UPI0033E1AA4B